jgi:hypothetical protein
MGNQVAFRRPAILKICFANMIIFTNKYNTNAPRTSSATTSLAAASKSLTWTNLYTMVSINTNFMAPSKHLSISCLNNVKASVNSFEVVPRPFSFPCYLGDFLNILLIFYLVNRTGTLYGVLLITLIYKNVGSLIELVDLLYNQLANIRPRGCILSNIY